MESGHSASEMKSLENEERPTMNVCLETCKTVRRLAERLNCLVVLVARISERMRDFVRRGRGISFRKSFYMQVVDNELKS